MVKNDLFKKGSNCPHYNEEVNRRPSYHELLANSKIKAGIATDDGVALHYVDQEISHIISSRPHSKAYHVYFDKTLKEIELETTYLGVLF